MEDRNFYRHRVNDSVVLLEQAVALDRIDSSAKEYAKARDLYRQAIHALQEAVMQAPNDEIKRSLAVEAKKWVERLKLVDAALKTHEEQRQAVREADVVHSGGGAQLKQEDIAKQFTIETPKVSWDDIQGLESAKKAMQEAVLMPQLLAHHFTGKLKPWKGILLFGPPGTGKTMLARAAATAHNGKFFTVTSADVMQKYVGESEKVVKTMFDTAMNLAPCVIFIDEIDALLPPKGSGSSDGDAAHRVRTQFQTCMDKVDALPVDKRVLVIGATNYPDSIDKAMVRRLERHVFVDLPDKAARELIIRYFLRGEQHDLTDADISDLASRTEYFSGANIESLYKKASMEPMNRLLSARRWMVEPEDVVNFKEATSVRAVRWCVDPGQPCLDEDPCSRCGSRLASLQDFDTKKIPQERLCLEHFKEALMEVRPTSSEKDLEKFKKFMKDSSSEA